MSGLAFGLNAGKSQPGISKPQKRKAFFDDEEDVPEHKPPPQYGAKKTSKPLRPLSAFDDDDDNDDGSSAKEESKQYGLQPAKGKSAGTEKYTNLSALRSAKLHDQEASKIDASVYDYDGAYETFHTKQEKKPSTSGQESVPKYMTSLLQSAEVRKRDQLRAKEKALQREREAEGDEFADKEKFVTGAYKKQQEEIRRLEEEEKKREEAEEERRRKGGGMTAFHKQMLQKDEERMRMIKEAEEEVAKKKATGVEDQVEAEEETTDSKIAEELNKQGARIVVNDEGEIVDKRQLLSAGLNAAPKKPGREPEGPKKSNNDARPQEYWRSSKAQDARQGQRERQSRMVERQIEEMAAKQTEAETEQDKAQQEKNKSRVTEADKMGAKERYLARKKEREEEARKKKEAGG
ncbi:uncharacterized protein PV06_06823 [Exophiala oligosperma]|uniref:Nuclear speckle splicing regulatory protein 1 N-terminal domain-containing protein n=1 Tax=Exophiala oligosperma TaxID=215243 RepID=A0A0D2DFP3_9EURO|nr:uncharacterized protein PV06_06823 [Exophiala oligosperma]KIW41250.1 hypothetical protein PV06_06823 [Exophiala oligosperma]